MKQERFQMYDERFVTPMREELTQIGVEEMRTPKEVEARLNALGTTLVVVNSICGCAARNARPAVARAIQHDVRPSQLTTVFAGQDVEAVQRARSYFTGYAPSSPQIALMKDREVVYMLERHQIEGRTAEDIAKDLTRALDKYCEKTAAA
ncbi:MAG TPA: BrxA/BrxB family bacilliredoxin [Gemmatimonadaceae bacterium]|nr:BrxA/BrxB family bacilliredoxin [Gemmatimonadaceae bacterium]